MSVVSQDSGSAGIAAASLTGEAQGVPNACASGNQAVPARWVHVWLTSHALPKKGSQRAVMLHDAHLLNGGISKSQNDQ